MKKDRLQPIVSSFFLLGCAALLLRPYSLFSGLGKVKLPEQKLDFTITEISREAGLLDRHEMEAFGNAPFQKVVPWLSSLGANIAVADVNGDGFYDIFFPSTKHDGKNHLYINQGNGKFSDEALKYGLENFGVGISRAAFFDCDNDGEKELFLMTQRCPILLKKKNGVFSPIPFAEKSDGCFWGVALNIFDYNRDGRLDIVMAGHQQAYKDFFQAQDIMPSEMVNAQNGGAVELYENQGNCKFKKKSDVLEWKENRFTLAIGLGDFRNLSQPDLWFATDFHKDTVLLSRKQDSNYVDGQELISTTLSHSGMNAETAYLDNDSYPSIFVTHAYRPGYSVGGNTLWKYDPQKQVFENSAEEQGIRRCGWAWGAKFLDLNNDSYLDLAVANGFISNSKVKDYMFKLMTIASSSSEIMANYQRWPDMRGLSLSGYERDCLYLNVAGKFVDISQQVNFDSDALDGRAVATVDFRNNGSQSILVANQKQRPYLYEVSQNNSNAWIGLRLVGIQSNRDAVGAKVKLTLDDGRVLVRELFPLNGLSAQSDERIHFGLGQNKIKNLVVFWPSGIVQELKSFELNRYHEIREQGKVIL